MLKGIERGGGKGRENQSVLINRPGVAGAVLQTPPSFINKLHYLDGIGCGSLNLQPAGRVVQITNISAFFLLLWEV